MNSFLPSPTFAVIATIFLCVALLSASLTEKEGADMNKQQIDSVLDRAFVEIDSNTTKNYSTDPDLNAAMNNYVSSIVEMAKGTSHIGESVGISNSWFFSFFAIPIIILFMVWMIRIPVLSLFFAFLLFVINKAKKNKWSNPKPLQPFLKS